MISEQLQESKSSEQETEEKGGRGGGRNHLPVSSFKLGAGYPMDKKNWLT